MADLKKIQAQLEKLIGDANQATGNTHTNLTDGVADLISGYGQGGSGITPSSMYRNSAILAPIYKCTEVIQ